MGIFTKDNTRTVIETVTEFIVGDQEEVVEINLKGNSRMGKEMARVHIHFMMEDKTSGNGKMGKCGT